MTPSPRALTVSDTASASPIAPAPVSQTTVLGAPSFATTFQDVLTHERRVLDEVAARLSLNPLAIEQACMTLSGRLTPAAGHRLIVSGIGKSGLIGRKIAATFSSMGTAATFLHPVEALHGDLGFVQAGDCGLLLSLSGETVELIRLATQFRQLGCPFVAITQSAKSTLGRQSEVCIELGDLEESCFLGLAPTSSTTAMLAVGDALAQAVARGKGFRIEDFARNHPGGSLGLRFQSARDLMRTGDRLVCIPRHTRVTDAVKLVSAARTGAAVLTNEHGGLLGIFTDGDLRRACLAGGNALDQSVEPWATMPCLSIDASAPVSDALKLYQNRRIEDLPVIDGLSRTVVGLLCLKDIPTF
jgi:arabinose-5-phosphate isomerase